MSGGFVNAFTYAIWKQIEAQQNVLSTVSVYVDTTFNISSEGKKRTVDGLYVSGEYFTTLGILPFLGRFLDEADNQRNAPLVCVLSYPFWKDHFGKDPLILGGTLQLSGHSFEIVGVAPPGFFGLDVGSKFDVILRLKAQGSFTVFHSVALSSNPATFGDIRLPGV